MADRDDDVSDLQDKEAEATEQKIINEEYKTWKKNAPFLYDLLLSTALDWPTLTTQWLPDKQSLPDKNYSTHRLLIGTHTSNGAPNLLQIANVQLPNKVTPDIQDYDDDSGEIGGYGGGPARKETIEVKFNIIQKIDHPGEVNKARYQPQNPNIIATMCTDGRVMVWDKSKHTSIPTGKIMPQIELHGHDREGYGLSWSPHQQGHLATAAEDKTVRLWDTTHFSPSNRLLKPSRTYTHHRAVVNDVQHHPIHSSLIGSVSDDITMQILDTRSDDTSRAAVSTSADQHSDAINAIAFNPAAESVVATGSADHTIGVWDLRSLKHKVHSLSGHSESVTSLEWHPFELSVLGSSSYDRRVLFWDLSRVGEEQSPEDSEDGPPELLFMHGGHTNRISDFSWNKNDPWVICSAAEDNLIQVWKVTNNLIASDEDEDIPIDELEA